MYQEASSTANNEQIGRKGIIIEIAIAPGICIESKLSYDGLLL